jgi:hypothetical protein
MPQYRKWPKRFPLTPPTNLVATPGNTLVNLSWALSNTTSVTTQRLMRSATGAAATDYTQIASLAPTATTYSDTGRTNGQQYWYKIRIEKDGEFSIYSDVATATPVGVPVGPVNPGALELNSTFNSIGIYLPYTGTPTVAAMRFRIAGGTWRIGLPLKSVQMDDNGGPVQFFSGSVVECVPGLQYQVEVTIAGTTPVDNLIYTRAENEIPDFSTLTPTRYVSPTGVATGLGLTPETAWTLAKAMSTAADSNDYFDPTLRIDLYPSQRRMIVQMAAGEYAGEFTRTGLGPITLLGAQTPVTYTPSSDYDPLTSTWSLVGTGATHSVVIPKPAQNWTPTDNMWEPVALTGPGFRGSTPGVIYNCWRWKGAKTSYKTMHVTPSATRYPNGTTTRYLDIPNLKAPPNGTDGTQTLTDGRLTTPQRWIEFLNNNKNWNVPLSNAFSFYVDPVTFDLYVRLPNTSDETPAVGDAGDNPNTYYGQMGLNQAHGIVLKNDCHAHGIDFRGNFAHVGVLNAASRTIVDSCVFYGGWVAHNDKGVTKVSPIPDVYGADNVIQRCMAFQTARAKRTPTDNRTIEWNVIKQPVYFPNNSTSTNRLAQEFESTFTKGSGSSQRRVVRWNYIDGWFNGLGTGQQDGYDRFAGSYNDFMGNMIIGAQDEAIEPEDQQMETRIWRNGIKDCSIIFGLADPQIGNMWVWRNWSWRTGSWISRKPEVAALLAGEDHEPGPVFIKHGQDSVVRSTVHFYHNTFWTDAGPTNLGSKEVGINGYSRSAGGTANQSCMFVSINNIWRMSGYVHNIEPHPAKIKVNGVEVDFASAAKTRISHRGQGNIYVSSAPANGVTRQPIAQLQGSTDSGDDFGVGNGTISDVANWRKFFASNPAGLNESTTNLIGATNIPFNDDATVDAWFENLTTGDLRLKAGVLPINSGVVVPNISDSYLGAGPDRGYKEKA